MPDIINKFNDVQKALEEHGFTNEASELKALAQLAVASKQEEREAKIKAIKIAGGMMDKIVKFITKKATSLNIPTDDFINELDKSLSGLEDDLTAVLTDFLTPEQKDA